MAAWVGGKKAATPTGEDISDRVREGYFGSVKSKAPLGCWKKAGIANSPAGDEDDLIEPELFAIWMKRGMSDWRKQYQEADPENASAPTLLATAEGQPAPRYPEEPSGDEDTDDEDTLELKERNEDEVEGSKDG